MVDTIKRANDPALSKTEAESGWRISAIDTGRALAKARRRMPNLEARLKRIRDARANR